MLEVLVCFMAARSAAMKQSNTSKASLPIDTVVVIHVTHDVKYGGACHTTHTRISDRVYVLDHIRHGIKSDGVCHTTHTRISVSYTHLTLPTICSV